jgi:uncharacterized protein YpmB
MNKRGQLMIIIIVAILIIAVGLLVYFFWPKISSMMMNEQQASRFLSSQAEPLRQSIADCVETTSQEGFNKIGQQAGYYDITGLPKISFIEKSFIVVVFKNTNKARINALPSKAGISKQFEAYLEAEGNQKIDNCLNNFASYKRVMDVEPGERKITAIIYDESILINTDWTIKISKPILSKKVSQTINQKPVELLIPLGNLYRVASDIVDCDVQIGCKFTGATWDIYTGNYPYLLRYITKKELNADDPNKRVFILESIPYRPGETAFQFNFGEDFS